MVKIFNLLFYVWFFLFRRDFLLWGRFLRAIGNLLRWKLFFQLFLSWLILWFFLFLTCFLIFCTLIHNWDLRAKLLKLFTRKSPNILRLLWTEFFGLYGRYRHLLLTLLVGSLINIHWTQTSALKFNQSRIISFWVI